MAFDFIDMIVNTSDEYLTGVFYRRRPISRDDGGVTFNYKQLDPNAKVFEKLLGELRKDTVNYAIKTNDDYAFNVGGYIQTQNGLLWEITDIVADEEVKEKGGNEVLRWFKTAKNREISIRMIQIDDLFNIQDTYDTKCNINIGSNQFLAAYTLVYLPHDGGFIIPTPIFEDTNFITIPVEKGSSVQITIYFKNGEEKTITVSSDKTVVTELNYRINV